MIELQIKGPRKQEIKCMLRQKSQQQKDKLQMLRIRHGSLKEYQTKKFTQISLPKLQKSKRKNDLSKMISLSVLNKIQQNKSLTNQQAQHLATLSPQKRINRLLIKTRRKQQFQDMEIFYGSQQKMSSSLSTSILKERIMKVLDLGQRRKLSLSHKKSIRSIKKIPRATTINSIENPVLDVCADSLSRKYRLKMKALQKDKQKMKQEGSIFIKLVDKRLNPSMCVIKKFKTEAQQKFNSREYRTEVMRKTRSKESLNEQIHNNHQVYFKDIEKIKLSIPLFQASMGPWRTSEIGFNS